MGILTLQTGAQVLVSNEVSIARLNGSTGTVFIGGGLLATAGHPIYVGREGAGSMTMSGGTVQARDLLVGAATNTGSGAFSMAGGSLQVSNSFVVGGASPVPGQASLAGGGLTVSEPGRTAFTVLPNGSLVLSGGELQTDNLLLTNTAGQLQFNAGILITSHTTVANGTPFVVGNGVTGATLYLNGGVHSFADGLVISTNATLSGCGTIVGPLTNQGTIATNCNAAPRPLITRVSKAGAVSDVSFTTVAGHLYTLQFATNPASAYWISVPPATNGSGNVTALQDPGATSAARFYRIAVQ
jgi:hypothetical protein